MTTPTSNLDVSDISDEINPAGYVQGQQDIGANNTIRQLTGSAAKTVSQAEILFSDLSNKIAFSEIYTASSTNTQYGVATTTGPITSELTLQANSDMYDPTLTWSYTIDGGSDNATADDLVVTKTSSKNVNVKLTSYSGTKVANLTVTGVMTVSGHTVNTCTKNIKLTVSAVNTAFQITAIPSLTVNATGVSAQTAAVTLKATSNTLLAGTTYRFTPSYLSGSGQPAITQTTDSISFTVTAPTPSSNAVVYSVLSEMIYDGRIVAANTSTIDINAQFIDRQITSLTPAALSNSQFSNSLNQYSTIDITAIHNSVAPTYAQGTITFTIQVTGDSVTQQTISSNTSAKVERISLYHNKDADGFGFKKATVVVVATLRSPDNVVMDEKRSEPITLRAGTYGLTLNAPLSNTQSGYSAQTAISAGSASWGAGNFAWTIRQFNGSGPVLTQDTQARSSTIDIRATSPSGKNASQAITNSSNYDITGVLSYDGITIESRTLSDILVSAQSLPYTYSVAAAGTSNIQFEAISGTTSSLLVTGSTSVGTITWTKDNPTADMSTNSTAANVFVTSSSSGSSNNQTVTVSGALYDLSARLIETLSIQNLNIDATTAKLEILGANVSVTSNSSTASATGVFDSLALFGTHSLQFPPTKISGQDLTVNQESPTKITVVASATQSSKSGVYRIVGQSVYRGITRTTNKDVSVSISALAPSLTITKYPYDYSEYITVNSDILAFSGQAIDYLIANGSEMGGGVGTVVYNTYNGIDFVAATDYPGTINTDFTITRVISSITNDTSISGPFYNQAANTNPAPDGYPATTGGNKRRDRIQSTLGTAQSLSYNITYELRDSSNNVLISNTVTDSVVIAPPADGRVQLSPGTAGSKYFTFTQRPTNGYGYPQPHPSQVTYNQNVAFTATYSSTVTIPSPQYIFARTYVQGAPIPTLDANTTTGQANLVGQSVYTDTGPEFEFAIPVVATLAGITGPVSVSAQLYSGGYVLGSPANQNYTFDLLMPPGKCYYLPTYSYGVRQQSTRDPFGYNHERIDYSRIPSATTLVGPYTKWLGIHTNLVYDQDDRPLYDAATNKRYYSNEAHRTRHFAAYPREQYYPNEIITAGYFMVLSFSQTGTPSIGQITLIGDDNNAYPIINKDLVAASSQNNSQRYNDGFHWYIFRFTPPAGVTFTYAFVSNYASYTPPPENVSPISISPTQPGNVLVNQNVNIPIGIASGGLILEDLYNDPGQLAQYLSELYDQQ